MRVFKIYSLSNSEIYREVLLTLVTVLYMEKTLSSNAPKVIDYLGPEAGMQAVMAKMPPVQIYTKLYLLNLKTPVCTELQRLNGLSVHENLQAGQRGYHAIHLVYCFILLSCGPPCILLSACSHRARRNNNDETKLSIHAKGFLGSSSVH